MYVSVQLAYPMLIWIYLTIRIFAHFTIDFGLVCKTKRRHGRVGQSVELVLEEIGYLFGRSMWKRKRSRIGMA